MLYVPVFETQVGFCRNQGPFVSALLASLSWLSAWLQGRKASLYSTDMHPKLTHIHGNCHQGECGGTSLFLAFAEDRASAQSPPACFLLWPALGPSRGDGCLPSSPLLPGHLSLASWAAGSLWVWSGEGGTHTDPVPFNSPRATTQVTCGVSVLSCRGAGDCLV